MAGDPGIRDNTGCAEPDPAFPAHLILAELVPHALIIKPDPHKEHDNRDNNDDSGNGRNESSRPMVSRAVKLMRMRKTGSKFTESHVTSESAGLDGWFNVK
jgi:hypothetical protein